MMLCILFSLAFGNFFFTILYVFFTEYFEVEERVEIQIVDCAEKSVTIIFCSSLDLMSCNLGNVNILFCWWQLQ